MILQSLLMITIFVADLNVTEATYTDQLGYQVVERGIIGAECAQQMGNEDFAISYSTSSETAAEVMG